MSKKTEEQPTSQQSSIKFKQIAGGADGLYGLSEDGKVFIYDDEDEAWLQLPFDDARILNEDQE